MTNFSPDLLDKLKADFAARPRQLFIGGDFCPAISGEVFQVIDPATGEVFARAAEGGAEDIDRAVTAAARAFHSGWARTAPAHRARLMLKLAELIEQHGDELALTETLDNGMPFMMARMGGVAGAVEQLRYNAGWATKLTGETIDPSWPGEWQAMTLREPVGVVGAITPWNFPLAMAVGKIAPALAAGCTVVLKPAEQSPLSAARLGELVAEAGFPAGVVNIVSGFGETAGAALAQHPGVDKISFTGSTQVGRRIVEASLGNLKRVTLELGGKSPVIVMPDADLERAIPAIAMGIFGNAGQICAAGSRLFVHESVYDKVVEGICERAQSLRLGPGLRPGTEMGPVISREQRDRVLAYIDSGLRDGAGLAAGGGLAQVEGCGGGFFIQPTVLTATEPGMRVVEEEIFGPVLCAMRFSDGHTDTIAAAANATQYGLSASIWTQNITTAHRLARRIRVGTVRINGGGGVDPALPLGGFKQSGWGRECGRAGVEAFTEIKSVVISL